MVKLEKQHELITQAKEIAIWLAEYLVQNLFYYYTAGKLRVTVLRWFCTALETQYCIKGKVATEIILCKTSVDSIDKRFLL